MTLPQQPDEPIADPAMADKIRRRPGIGRDARAPGQIPWRGWKQVIARTAGDMISDRISLSAAGCAFYATLALFPAITMLVSLYGLMFDPQTVEPQLRVLRGLIPGSAYALVADRIRVLVSHGRDTLSLSLLIGTGFALWSATSGTKAVILALNVAYDERETRSILRFQATAIAMTFCAICGASLAIALLVALPAGLDLLRVQFHQALLIRLAGFATLLGLVLLSLSLLYRFAPCRASPRWRWVTPGSVVATAIWLSASWLFSYYVGHVANYDATYGPLGAVIGIMMWFFVTAYAILLGAELNAELELQTAHDSTDGPPKPIGERGAYVADHVAE